MSVIEEAIRELKEIDARNAWDTSSLVIAEALRSIDRRLRTIEESLEEESDAQATGE